MQSNLASQFDNPYASPASTPQPVSPPAAAEAQRPGSLGLIILGFVLLLGGYFTSNIFAISDLYQVGFGPDGQVIPSPFAAASTPAQQWLFYILAASAAIAGCVLIGSQNSNPLTVVCYVMCPLAGLIFLIGMPLRTARKFAVPIASAYLAIGTCLAGAGLMRMVSLYGQANSDVLPVLLASILTEAGLALLVGALLKLWRAGAFSSPPLPSTGEHATAR